MRTIICDLQLKKKCNINILEWVLVMGKSKTNMGKYNLMEIMFVTRGNILIIHYLLLGYYSLKSKNIILHLFYVSKCIYIIAVLEDKCLL